MNCVNHPEVPAAAFCRECGKPMCVECQRPALGSVYCVDHAPVTATPEPPPPAAPPVPPASSPYTAPYTATYTAPSAASGPQSYSAPGPSPYTAPVSPLPRTDMGAHPVLALILGFIPGVGAIYNGQYAKGLIHAVVFGLLVSMADSTHGVFSGMIGILIAAWVFYMAFEAYHTARNRRYGAPVEEFSSLFDIRPSQGRFPAGAILLIALGFILLLNTTDLISMDQLERYWPIGLIVFGLYLLYSRVGPDHTPVNPRGRNAEAPK